MENDILKIDSNSITYSFDLDGKRYCVLEDENSELEGSVYFAQATKLDDDNYVLTRVPQKDLEKVTAEYNKQMDFFESSDELDEDGGEINE